MDILHLKHGYFLFLLGNASLWTQDLRSQNLPLLLCGYNISYFLRGEGGFYFSLLVSTFILKYLCILSSHKGFFYLLKIDDLNFVVFVKIITIILYGI